MPARASTMQHRSLDSEAAVATISPAIARLDLTAAQLSSNQAGALNSGRVPLSARRLSKAVLHADSSGTASGNASGIVMLTDSAGTPRAVRVVQKEESEGRNIIRVGWVWSLDGKTFQIELRHGRKSGVRKGYMNRVCAACTLQALPAGAMHAPCTLLARSMHAPCTPHAHGMHATRTPPARHLHAAPARCGRSTSTSGWWSE